MAKPFLRQVAEHYLELGFGKRVFVFPNRRSMVFFKKYISDILEETGGRPVLAPVMLGINEFFQAMAGRKTCDRISLLLKLYGCYSRLRHDAEPLDDFIYWGDTLLADFNDIDKYRIDASQLFTNINDLKMMTDDLSYLTEEQAEALRRLSDRFKAEHWQKDAKRKIDVKESFLGLWNILFPLYRTFRKELAEDGRAYEGMLYRDLADSLKTTGPEELLRRVDSGAESCVFIGLNTLNPCEHAVLAAFRDHGMADFCWDYPAGLLHDEHNRASLFMRRNTSEFPDPVEYDRDGLEIPEFNIVSVPSAAGQAKVLHEIIRRIPENERRLDMAVVLPDETMLGPVTSSLPDSVKTVNVTMGYPLASSEWNAFMRNVIALQMHVRDGRFFYHRQVYDIFSCGIVKDAAGEDGAACMDAVQKEARAFIPVEDLQKGEIFSTVFCPAADLKAGPDAAKTAAFAAYLIRVVETVAHTLDPEKDTIHMECAYRYLQCLRKLSALELAILPKTFAHLVEQMVGGVSVPFSGEPLDGMQIMGPLETRALDFKHLVILNANEGIFPGREIRPSYIPPELRVAFGLPTYELQDSVWAYYFYCMAARAEDVWMVYDSRTDGLVSGEESRYIKQLRHLYPQRCTMHTYTASCGMSASKPADVEKTPEDIKIIRNAVYSPSSIHKYLVCPMQFYYYVVKKLYPKNEVTEDMDRGMLGTVCHDTLQAIYCCEEAMDPGYFFDKRNGDDGISSRTAGTVTVDFIKGWLKREDDIMRKIKALICKQLNCRAVEGRDLVAADIAMKFVKGVLEADLKQIEKRGPLKIVGLEKEYRGRIEGHTFKGYVDRLDSFENGTVRIVDYKTGSDSQDVLDPSQGPESIAEAVFAKDTSGHKAAFQFFVYDTLGAAELGGVKLENAMYSMTEVFSKEVKSFKADEDVNAAISRRLGELFEDMENPDIPFTMVKDDKPCRHCDYAVLCGRTKKEQ